MIQITLRELENCKWKLPKDYLEVLVRGEELTCFSKDGTKKLTIKKII
jgi:hypothetical protein